MRVAMNQRGFTLLEAAIVAAVLSILVAVAYPSYVGHVTRSNRAAAKAVLEQAAQYMERQFTTTNAYPNASDLAAANYLVVPLGATSASKKYDISLGAGSGTNAFVLVATPATSSVDPQCQTLTMDNIGNRTSSAGVSLECWQK